MSNSFKLCPTHFPEGAKILQGGLRLLFRPRGYRLKNSNMELIQTLRLLPICRACPSRYGAHARPRREAPLSNGVMTSSCSVNRATTFLPKML